MADSPRVLIVDDDMTEEEAALGMFTADVEVAREARRELLSCHTCTLGGGGP